MKYTSFIWVLFLGLLAATAAPAQVHAEEDWISGFESDQNIIQYIVENGELGDYEFGGAAEEYASYANDFDGHQDVWEQVSAVAGEAIAKEQISSFRLYTDGVSNFLGWVIQENNWDTWLVSLDVLDIEDDPEEFQATLIHEMTHVFTLDNEQMDISGAVYDEQFDDCDTYLNADGCLSEDSYLYAFVEEYWDSLFDVHDRIDPSDEDALYDFYLDYEDQFINDYAATSPEEDIAEAFSYFVLWDYVEAAAIWEEKLNFFFDYPELMERRSAIRDYYDLDEDVPEIFSDEVSYGVDDEVVDHDSDDVNDLDGDGVLTPTSLELPESGDTTDLIDRLAGKIMLMVDRSGEAWYVDPISRARYYLQDGPTAYDFLRAFGLGITNNDLATIPTSEDEVGGGAAAERLAGRILLQVEENGEAWYINPADLKRYYLRDGDAAYEIMRELSLGTMAQWLDLIPSGWIQ
jgi:hypothetical protein